MEHYHQRPNCTTLHYSKSEDSGIRRRHNDYDTGTLYSSHSQYTTKHTPNHRKVVHRTQARDLQREIGTDANVYKKPRRIQTPSHYSCVGNKWVSKMRYLGVILDRKLDWSPHSQHLELKLLRIRNRLVRCFKVTWGMSFHNLLTIFKHATLPVITYASEAW